MTKYTGCCFSPVVKIATVLMMIFNYVFWVSGIIILALGIWIKTYLYKYLELSFVYQPEVPFILIGLGVLIVLIGCLGCCCTIKGHPGLLYMFSGFLFIVFIIEVSTGISVIVYSDKIEDGLRDGLADALQNYDNEMMKTKSQILDHLQEEHVCCGIATYKDWFSTPYSRKQTGPSVPESCCLVSVKQCHHVGLRENNFTTKDINTQGCLKPTVYLLEDNLHPIGWVALIVSLFQILGAFLAVYLAKSVDMFRYEQIA